MDLKYIITIGREYGSGGRFIAKLLAEKLNIKYYDSELIAKAAQESGIDPSVFEQYDEKKEFFFGGASGLYSYDIPLSQKVFLAQNDAIKEIAESGESAVIVGRCADYVLKEYENRLSVFICAPMEDKINRVVKYYGIDPKKAESVILKTDKKRRGYYNFYTDGDWGMARNYDICVNSKIGIEESVNAIVAYVNGRFNKQN